MNNLAAAFIKAKRDFGPALKDKSNPAFRSKYADLGACIDAVEEALLAQGIAFLHETSEDPTGVTVETVFLHESGEERRCGKLHVPAAKQDPQGYGSALTYARRYSLMAACGIAPEDDDGNAASKRHTSHHQGSEVSYTRTPPQVGEPGAPVGAKAAALHASGELGDMSAVDTLARKIIDNFAKAGPARCANFIAEEKLDDTETIYLSTKLPSNMNSAIKKAQEAARRETA